MRIIFFEYLMKNPNKYKNIAFYVRCQSSLIFFIFPVYSLLKNFNVNIYNCYEMLSKIYIAILL